MRPKLPFLIRFLPLWELLAFILVGYFIGFLWALLILICTSLIGFLIVRVNGLQMMRTMKENPLMGAAALINSLQNSLFMLGGFLLMIPGFITDILGILCLIPFIRKFLINRFIGMNMKAAQSMFTQMSSNMAPRKTSANDQPTKTQNIRQGQTIEGEFWKDDDDSKPN